MAHIRFGRHKVGLPKRRLHRRIVGGALVAGGLVGFLPIVGFWMVPVGLIVLSHDSAPIRRFRRKSTVGVGSWLKRRYPGVASKFGFTVNGKPAGG
ncbi:MAG: hypothetical protein JNM20_05755 [Rhizobiales bacterium]|nr:hypothetical protein [Hyphomicrobiales bacterium]